MLKMDMVNPDLLNAITPSMTALPRPTWVTGMEMGVDTKPNQDGRCGTLMETALSNNWHMHAAISCRVPGRGCVAQLLTPFAKILRTSRTVVENPQT